MTLQPPDVIGAGEVLELLGISKQAFSQSHQHRPDFPPARELKCGPVYERRAIVAYAKQRATGKPYLRALERFRFYASSMGAIGGIAAELEVSPITVRRYLQQLGEIPR
jgi:hypothetical protein